VRIAASLPGSFSLSAFTALLDFPIAMWSNVHSCLAVED
jgi:hypothetical protein